MGEVRATRRISAAPERAWALLSDRDRYADWADATVMSRATSPEMGVGATYEERNRLAGPLTVATTWVVESFDAPRRQVHRGEGVPQTRRFEAEFAVSPVSEAVCDVTVAFRFERTTGLAEALDRAVMQRLLQKGVERSLVRFEQLLR